MWCSTVDALICLRRELTNQPGVIQLFSKPPCRSCEAWLAVFSWKSWSWQLAKQESRNKMPGEREVRDLSFDEPLGASQRTGISGRNFPTKFRIDLRFVKIYDVVQARAGFSERDLIRHHAAWIKGYLISMKAHGSTLMSWSLSSSFLYVSFWWVLRFWRSCAICLWNQAIWISTCFQCVSWKRFCRACRRTWYFSYSKTLGAILGHKLQLKAPFAWPFPIAWYCSANHGYFASEGDRNTRKPRDTTSIQYNLWNMDMHRWQMTNGI